jgi:outer membrane autotransporter protein
MPTMHIRATALFIAVTAALSMQARAQQVSTDTGHIDVTPGTYQTTANDAAGVVFAASQTGSIAATDADAVSSGRMAHGALASDGGTILLNRGTVTTSGAMAAGLMSVGAGSVIMANGTSIATTGADSVGVDAESGGEVTLLNGTVSTANGWGLQTYGGNIAANNERIVSSGEGGAITDNSGMAGGGNITLDNVEVVQGRPGVTGPQNYPGILISALGGLEAHLQASDLTETTYSNGSIGISLNGGALGAGGLHKASATLTGTNQIITFGDDSYGVWAVNSARGSVSAVMKASNLSITTQGKRAAGLVAQNGASIDIDRGTIETWGEGAHGLYVFTSDDSIDANNLTVRTAFGHGAVVAGGGEIQIANSTVTAQAGVALFGFNAGSQANRATVSNSELRSENGYALYTRGGEFDVTLDNTTVHGGSGLFGSDYMDPATQQGASSTYLTADNNSQLFGDVRIAAGNDATLILSNGSLLQGALLQGNRARIDLQIDGSSTWHVTGNSVLHDLNNLGNVTFDAAGYHQAHVTGGYNGGGSVTLHTYLNAGGALTNQYTDRLLIDGNASGTTLLHVQASGSGANTNVAGDHQWHDSEGISLVQVGGSARADSFKLAGDYVTTAGSPYQYRLFAYQGAAIDDAQKLLPNTNWDYRLQTAYVDQNGHIVPGAPDGSIDPGNTSPDQGGNGGDTAPLDPPADPLPPGRQVLAPQMSSYLTAPIALQSYDAMVSDGLRQRLGDIRQGQAGADTGEFYLRQLADSGSYRSNLAFFDYGYGFGRQAHALQAGGNWLHQASDTQDLRLGAAVTLGRMHYQPDVATAFESIQTDVQARHWALTATWQQANGWYADAVASLATYRGEVDTAQRGRAGKLGANAFHLSLESGRTFTIANGMTIEPSIQLQHERLSTHVSQDVDGLQVGITPSHTTVFEGGVRMAWPVTRTVAPYVRLAFDHAWCSGAQANIAGVRFDTGCLGSAAKFGMGANGQLTKRLSIYGEVDGRRRLERYGLSDVAGTLGLRYAL